MKAILMAACVLAAATAASAGAPTILLNGPGGDVVEGDISSYTLALRNDGIAPVPAPITVDMSFPPGLVLLAATENGWSCGWTAPGGAASCVWFADLEPGDSTGLVDMAFIMDGPFGTADDCEPGRSPCVPFRATTPGADPGLSQVAVIAGGNHPPVAADDAASVASPPGPTLIDVLANDSDADLDPLDVSILVPPLHGSAVYDPASSQVLYTPDPGFTSDTFRYRVTDPSGAAASAQVNVVLIPGTVQFLSALVDFGNMEVGHVGLHRTLMSNTLGEDLFGHAIVEAVPAADVPAVLAGTGYDPTQVAFDPELFQPYDGASVSLPSFPQSAFLFKTRAKAPLGRVWLAKVTFQLFKLSAPTDQYFTSIYVVARSADASEVPVHVNDDAVTVFADRMTLIHPLVNDVSVAGIPLSVTSWGIAEPWAGGPLTQGTVSAHFPAPFLALEFTPNAGFLGTTDLWYAASETPNGIFNDRYDYAKVTVTVIPAVPPPVAVASGSALLCGGGSAALSGSGGISCSWSPATGLSDAASCAPTAAPASTTTYTLTVVDAYGQSSTNDPTVTITVAPVPVAVAAGSTTIVAGQSTPLSGSGGAFCDWSPATGLSDPFSCTPMASPIVTTTYALVVTSGAGCTSVNPATVTITVVPGSGSPDLSNSISSAPPQAEAGLAISLQINTVNGGGSAAGATTTRIYLSRDAVLDAGDVPLIGPPLQTPALPAGQGVAESAILFLPANLDGKLWLIASADDGHVVAESNETNNTSARKINVRKSH